MLQMYSMTLVSVIRCVSFDIVLSHSAFNDVRRLSDVGIERQKFVADVADKVESVIGTTADDTDTFFKLETSLK